MPTIHAMRDTLPGKWIDTGIIFVLTWWLVGLIIDGPGDSKNKKVVTLGGISWGMEDFCRHWLITGNTGSGKTASGIANIFVQLLKNVPNFGAVFLDQKGDLWKMVQAATQGLKQSHRLVLLQVRPLDAGRDWQPRWTMNLIGDPALLPSSIADTLADAAVARKAISLDGNAAHFVSQAKIHIAKAVEFYRMLDENPTIPKIYRFLSLETKLDGQLEKLNTIGTIEAEAIYDHFQNYLQIADEERSGIKGTITNMLSFYCESDLEEVFCVENPNFTVDMVDQAKIVCVSIPQKYKAARQLVNTFIKLSLFEHGLKRFDRAGGQDKGFNLIVGFFDEAQRLVTKSELGAADHNTVDQVRAARLALIYSTQAERSFVPVLGRDITNTLVDNLSNELIFKSNNEEDAEKASKRIGSRPIMKVSYSEGKGGTNRTRNEQIEAYIRPHQLRALPKHVAVIRHCEGKWKKAYIAPTTFTSPIQDNTAIIEQEEAIA
ncbi:MAG: type IV secretory system conjugative DNA transfer family protein [Verrucomicrobiae bacterium]|nr:type IV secretory system conjugative DNA transfer family protein [Verrucomicrobiae bacterium]